MYIDLLGREKVNNGVLMFRIIIFLLCLAVCVFAGSFKDKRDNQVYKTVKIGNQVWMAQNLNYSIENGSGSWCYDNEYINCKEYGRLYTYYTAMNACPMGWHLPSEREWETLFEYVGGMNIANFVLRSKGDWIADDGDHYNFKVLPAGAFVKVEEAMFFSFIFSAAVFRTTSKDVNYSFSGDYANVVKDKWTDPYEGTSVRCLKDY